jgi:hypothetical protein
MLGSKSKSSSKKTTDSKAVDSSQKTIRSKFGDLDRHPEFRAARLNGFVMLMGMTLFTIMNVYFVVRRGDPALKYTVNAAVLVFSGIFLMVVLFLWMSWDRKDSVTIMLLLIWILGLVTGICFIHNLNNLLG